jgi:lipopolysaccharide export system protein LptA
MMHRSFVILLVTTALAIAAGTAQALRSDAKQPINIHAKSVDVSEKTGVATYRGNVVLSQGTLKIEADRLEVHVRDGRTHVVRASGNPVQLRTRTDAGEDLHITANRAEYYVQERRINLYDNVILRRNKDVVTGSTVRYHFDTQSLSADGGDKGVSAVIHPAAPTRP